MIEKNTPAFSRITWSMSFAAVVVFACLHALQPLLPELSRTFALSELETSWTYAIGTLSLGISLLFYGALSDAFGRRELLIWTLIGMTLCTFALTQVDSYGELLFWRALQGFCLGGLPAIAIAYLGEELSRPAMLSAVASYISASSLGGILGRLLAGFFAELGHWPWAFWPLVISSVVLSIVVVRYLPPSQHFEAKPFSWRVAAANNWFHLRQPVLLTTFLIGGLNFFIYVNQYTYMSFVLAAPPFSMGSGLIGLLFLTYLTGTLGSALSSRIAQKLPAPLAMALGVLIMILGSLVTLWQSIPMIILGFFITAFGFFVTHSLASSWVNRHAIKAKASASALYLVFYYVGASTGSLYLQPFWQWQQWSGVVVGSCLMLGFTLLLCLSLRRFGQ